MSATTLQQAYDSRFGGGRWSFTLGDAPDSAFVTSDLLSMTMEAYTARPWIISLSAFQYQGGNSALDPTLPPRNQVDSRGYFARVTWAVDGAQEAVDVDYRPGGGTVQVVASMIRVALGSSSARNPASGRPMLSGSIAPGVRHCGVSPTFTTAVQSIPAGGNSGMFPIPPRACAYRWLITSSSTATVNALQNCVISERAGDVATPTIVQTPSIGADADGNGLVGAAYLMENKAAYYVPHPQSQFVRVTNLDTVSGVVIAIQFLLDMG